MPAFSARGVPVTWGTVLAGFDLCRPTGRRFTGTDVVALAAEALSDSGPEAPPLGLIDLAWANPMDDEEVGRRLSVLAEGVDLNIEGRKLRLLDVEDALDSLPKDPLYGLLGLSEFWLGLGLPADSPHEVQGVGRNTSDPAEYYTEAHFRAALARHRDWLEEERAALSGGSAD